MSDNFGEAMKLSVPYHKKLIKRHGRRQFSAWRREHIVSVVITYLTFSSSYSFLYDTMIIKRLSVGVFLAIMF